MVARARSQAGTRGSRQDRNQAEIRASRRHILRCRSRGAQKAKPRRRITVPAAALVEKAPAKVNLTLRVVGRRSDGYHEIDSLVAFAAVADVLRLTPGPTLSLSVSGPTGPASGGVRDNLVLKAAHALAAQIECLKLGRFALSKRLPVAAGLGGGSADAAAALRVLARGHGLALDDPRLMPGAPVAGAVVPVVLDPRPRLMGGIGDVSSEPLDLPKLAAVLVNPGVAVPTREVF